MNDVALPKILWLWIPLGLALVQISFEILFSANLLAKLYSEGGPTETMQFLCMLAASFVAGYSLTKVKFSDHRGIFSWLLLALICSIYVAGEEVSWGQHILSWSTPDYWKSFNDQAETNLHNMTSWLDQKPRLLLLIGIIVGGLITPLLQKYKEEWVPQKFNIIYPPKYLCIPAFFCLAIQIIDGIDERLEDLVIFERSSEIQEFYMFYFVLLYLLAFHKRITNPSFISQ